MRIIDLGSVSVIVSNEEFKLYEYIKKKQPWPKKADVSMRERTQMLVKQLVAKGLIKRYREDGFTFYKAVENKSD